MKWYLLLVIFFYIPPYIAITSEKVTPAPEVTIVGFFDSTDGIGSVPTRIIDCIKDSLQFNCIETRNTQLGYNISNTPLMVGPVALFTDLLWIDKAPFYIGSRFFTKIPQNCIIKIAYTMSESSIIPKQWVDVLNNYFDAAVVPDPWLINIYQQSGVKIPIFVIPLSLNLADFFTHVTEETMKKPFVFGNMAGLTLRKNHLLLVQAFAHAFGNNPDVILDLHSKNNDQELFYCLMREKNKFKLNNVRITMGNITNQQYRERMATFDCYATFSFGEGYSIPPRQALAMGIPVVLTNNSAHITLADSGYVKAVPTTIRVPAYYSLFGQALGCFTTCTVEQAAQALKEIYNNYEYYKEKAEQGRTWVKQYTPENVRLAYVSLIKPKKVTLGTVDKIDDDGIQTTSKQLYEKYKKLLDLSQ